MAPAGVRLAQSETLAAPVALLPRSRTVTRASVAHRLCREVVTGLLRTSGCLATGDAAAVAQSIEKGTERDWRPAVGEQFDSAAQHPLEGELEWRGRLYAKAAAERDAASLARL